MQFTHPTELLRISNCLFTNNNKNKLCTNLILFQSAMKTLQLSLFMWVTPKIKNNLQASKTLQNL